MTVVCLLSPVAGYRTSGTLINGHPSASVFQLAGCQSLDTLGCTCPVRIGQ